MLRSGCKPSEGNRGCLSAAPDIEFVEDVRKVALYCPNAEDERFADFAVTAAFREQLEHLDLTRGESGKRRSQPKILAHIFVLGRLPRAPITEKGCDGPDYRVQVEAGWGNRSAFEELEAAFGKSRRQVASFVDI